MSKSAEALAVRFHKAIEDTLAERPLRGSDICTAAISVMVSYAAVLENKRTGRLVLDAAVTALRHELARYASDGGDEVN
ncbi:MAG TPA: hypothetical protein VIL72_07945 [Beijerinckiaceae bacterium]